MADSGYDTAASSYYSSSISPQMQHQQGQQQLQYQSANNQGYYNQDPHAIPQSYYEHSEEDELLDAIATWQDQKD